MSWYKVTNGYGVSRRMLTIWENICKVVLKLTIFSWSIIQTSFWLNSYQRLIFLTRGKTSEVYFRICYYRKNTRYHHKHLPFTSFIYNCCCVVRRTVSDVIFTIIRHQDPRAKESSCHLFLFGSCQINSLDLLLLVSPFTLALSLGTVSVHSGIDDVWPPFRHSVA